jgi:hypothetical protein
MRKVMGDLLVAPPFGFAHYRFNYLRISSAGSHRLTNFGIYEPGVQKVSSPNISRQQFGYLSVRRVAIGI